MKWDTNDFQLLVARFHAKMKAVGARSAMPETYTPLDRETALLRSRLIMEEAKEFEAAAEIVGLSSMGNSREAQIEMIDAICDILYVTFGTAVAMGLDIRPFFLLVHDSNMKKFTEGSYLREDGKWMKPPDWVKPDLGALLDEIEADELANGEHRA